jgi:hypothetical protein
MTDNMDYYETLKKLHKVLRPKTYLEVGIRVGESFQFAGKDTLAIGIDPAYEMKYPYVANSILVKDTSDNFFDNKEYIKILKKNPVDFAFIDGMHLFEFAFRDFINVEKYSHRQTVIAIHDCVPRDKKTAERERTTKFWTGDVWKLVKILEKYRPDLKIHVLDASPSGLVLVTNLDPNNKTLSENYEKIEKEFLGKSYTKEQLIKTEAESKFNFNTLATDTASREGKSRKKRRLKRLLRKPKALGVLLCYNDGDILEDTIKHLLDNNHDLVVWDHGSTDNTATILDQYKDQFVEYKKVPRAFDFYKLYPEMSKNLIENFVGQYDWISWPDQDEILEGPSRKKTYYEYITKVYRSGYDWIEFRNFNYWFTEKDEITIKSPVARVKHYSLFPDVSPRIRSWRAEVTNERVFNHNPLPGKKYPVLFNLRHYPMRSLAQMKRRLTKDRVNLQRGKSNYHYNVMKEKTSLKIPSNELHRDNGGELNHDVIFDWNSIYRDKTT